MRTKRGLQETLGPREGEYLSEELDDLSEFYENICEKNNDKIFL
jgi:hypothetical protein